MSVSCRSGVVTYLCPRQRSWGLNSSHQAWQQRSLSTEPSYCPTLSHLRAVFPSFMQCMACLVFVSTQTMFRRILFVHIEVFPGFTVNCSHLCHGHMSAHTQFYLSEALVIASQLTWRGHLWGGRSVLGKWTLFLCILRLAVGGSRQRLCKGSPRVHALSYDILVTMEEGQFGDGGSYVSFALGRTGWALAYPAPPLSS